MILRDGGDCEGAENNPQVSNAAPSEGLPNRPEAVDGGPYLLACDFPELLSRERQNIGPSNAHLIEPELARYNANHPVQWAWTGAPASALKRGNRSVARTTETPL